MKSFLLIVLVLGLTWVSHAETTEEIKNYQYQQLVENTDNILQDSDNVKAALEAMQEKMQEIGDNPFESSTTAKEAIDVVEKLVEGTDDDALTKEVMEQIQTNLQQNLQNDFNGEYCEAAEEYLKASDKLMEIKEANEENQLKEGMKNATNLVIQCKKFAEGQLNMSLENSELKMKEVNPDENQEIDIDVTGAKVKLNSSVMQQVKQKAGTSDNEEVVVAIKSVNKNQAGLNEESKNRTLSNVITAEFKKRTSEGVEDIEVGSLEDGNIVEIEFDQAVQKEGNMCARYENGEWVESGEFGNEGSETSNVCLMNHASEYAIVTKFAAKIGMYALVLMLAILWF